MTLNMGLKVKSRYGVGLTTLNQAISIVSGVDSRLEDLNHSINYSF